MATPRNYEPEYSFGEGVINNEAGRNSVNAKKIDSELKNISIAITELNGNLSLIQREDGLVRDSTVAIHSLSRQVINMIGNFNLRGEFTHNSYYGVGDVIDYDGVLYACHTAHNSDDVFVETNFNRFGFSGDVEAAVSADIAKKAAKASENSKNGAASSADDAGKHELEAKRAKEAAESSETEAKKHLENVVNSEQTAVSAKDRAEEIALAVEESASDVVTAKNDAEAAAREANRAFEAAQLTAGIFKTIAIGLLSTESGSFFSVPSPSKNGYVVLYENSNGTAIPVKEYPSADAVDNTSYRDRLGAAQRYAQKITSPDDDVAWGVVDELGNRTWIEVSEDDGGPTSGAINHIQRGLGFKVINNNGHIFLAITDISGVVTDLAIDENGQLCDFVIESIANRIIDMKPTKVAVFGSSTFADMHPHFIKQFSELGISDVFLGGDSGAIIDSISARLGAGNPEITIPSGVIISGIKNIVLTSWFVDPGMFSWVASLSNGVKGAVSYDSEGKNYLFTPSNINVDVDVGDESFSVIPESFCYQSGIVLINAGKNNLTNANDEINGAKYVFDETILMTDQVNNAGGKFIVMGNFINTGQSGFASAQRILDLNKMLKNKYGLFYFDVQEYLTGNEVWADTGLTPTYEDLDQQGKGELCVSLARNAGHMNSVASSAVCSKLIKRLLILNMIKDKINGAIY